MRLKFAHDAVRAEATIAAYHLRFTKRGQVIKDLEQTRQRMVARVFIARLLEGAGIEFLALESVSEPTAEIDSEMLSAFCGIP